MPAPVNASLEDSQLTVDRVLETLDAEIEERRLRVLAVKTYRNTLAHISRLPPEVLSEVFIALAYSFEIEDFNAYRMKRPRYHRWLTVTFVCRHWRAIALCTTRIWNRIALHGTMGRILAFLKRSSHAPLEFHQPYDKELSSQLVREDVLKLVIEHLHRTRRLEITLDEGFNAMLISNGFHAPVLRDLQVTSAFKPKNRAPADFPYFSNANLQRLESLSLHSTSFALVHSLRPTLTELNVYHPPQRQPTGSLVAVIQGLPLLKTLSLEHVISNLGVPIQQMRPPGRQVALPHLTSLRLTDPGVGTACADFLNHLLVPPSCCQMFTAVQLGSKEDYVFIFKALEAIVSHSTDSETPPCLPWGCQINNRYRGSLDLELWNEQTHVSMTEYYDSDKPPNFDTVEPDIIIQLALQSYPPTQARDELLDQFFKVYPLSEVRALHTDWSVDSLSNWETIAARMSKLEALEIVSEWGVPGFLETAERSMDGQIRTYPNLKFLALQMVKLDKLHENLKKRKTRVNSLAVRLMRELEARRSLGIGIKALGFSRMSQCEHEDEDVPRIRGLVGEFYYDFRLDGEENDCSTCASGDEDDGTDSIEEEEDVDGEGEGDEDEIEDEIEE